MLKTLCLFALIACAAVQASTVVGLSAYLNTNCTGTALISEFFWTGRCVSGGSISGAGSAMASISGNSVSLASYNSNTCSGSATATVSFTCGSCAFGSVYTCGATPAANVPMIIAYSGTGCSMSNAYLAIQESVSCTGEPTTCQNNGTQSAQFFCTPPSLSGATSLSAVGVVAMLVAALLALMA